MTKTIVPIVEGQSEVASVPVLLRRLLHERRVYHVVPARPFRVHRYGVEREGELERAITQAVKDRENPCAILVLLDADDACPAELGPKLLARCRKATSLPAAVVLARHEFENWFLGAKESLRGVRGIKGDASSPPDPEGIRDAKGRLSANMDNRRYLQTDDQAALAERFDYVLARERCPSFDKFLLALDQLLAKIPV